MKKRSEQNFHLKGKKKDSIWYIQGYIENIFPTYKKNIQRKRVIGKEKSSKRTSFTTESHHLKWCLELIKYLLSEWMINGTYTTKSQIVSRKIKVGKSPKFWNKKDKVNGKYQDKQYRVLIKVIWNPSTRTSRKKDTETMTAEIKRKKN